MMEDLARKQINVLLTASKGQDEFRQPLKLVFIRGEHCIDTGAIYMLLG